MEVTEYIEKNLPTTMDSVIGLLDRVEKEIVNEMKKRVITMKKGVIVSDEEQGGYIDEN